MEFGIDLRHKILNMAQFGYEDAETPILEFVQNSQRCGAELIEITIKDGKVIMRDHGPGVADPSLLFTMSRSGWDESIASQNPFGEGFFSMFRLGGMVEVRSQYWTAKVNIEDLKFREDLDVIRVWERSRYLQGVWVEITNLRDDVNIYSLADNLEDIVKYVPIKIKINGSVVTKAKHFDKTDEPFSRKVEGHGYRGVVWPTRFYRSMQVYSHHRPVENLYFNHLGGRIECDWLNLTMPDRKRIVRDNEYQLFDQEMQREAKKLAFDVISKAGDEDLKEYEDFLSSHLTEEEIAHNVRVKIVNADSLEAILEMMEKTGVDMDEVFRMMESETLPVIPVMGEGYELTLPTTTRSRKGEKTGEKISLLKKGFYCEKGDAYANKNKIELAKYYNITVAIARNKLESIGLKFLGWKHISQLGESVEREMIFDYNYIISPYERDIQDTANILAMELGYGMVVTVASYDVVQVTDLGDMVHQEKLETRAVAYCGAVYINAKHISSEPREAFARMGVTLCHELAHLAGYNDGEIAHYEAQLKLIEKMLEIVSNL